MRLPKRGERGFTLIELLIVVAILGVLAAVVIPNVTQFFGRGEDEARRTEFHNVSLAVASLMIDNGISGIVTPVYVPGNRATNQMGLVSDGTSIIDGFPDYQTAIIDKVLLGTEPLTQVGYVLFDHQIGYDDPDDDPDAGINFVKQVSYLNMRQTVYFYSCTADGTVSQWSDASCTTEYTE